VKREETQEQEEGENNVKNIRRKKEKICNVGENG
jgi:hypothetical protein